MRVQRVDDALHVVLTGSDDVALVLCILEAEVGETTLHRGVDEIQALLQCTGLALDCDLVVVTHFENRLLCLAATVFEGLCHLQIACQHRVDDSLR